MKLDQLDKLKELIDELIIKLRRLKYENMQLERENKELKDRLELFGHLPQGIDFEAFDSLLLENEKLKGKNKDVKTQLQELISELEQKTIMSGVDPQ